MAESVARRRPKRGLRRYTLSPPVQQVQRCAFELPPAQAAALSVVVRANSNLCSSDCLLAADESPLKESIRGVRVLRLGVTEGGIYIPQGKDLSATDHRDPA